MAEILGDEHDNTLTGTDDDDKIKGFDGNDILKGGKGEDDLSGGKGNDILDGGDGSDILKGDEGDDTFFVQGHEKGGDFGDEVKPGTGTNSVKGSREIAENGVVVGHGMNFNDMQEGVTIDLTKGVATSTNSKTTFPLLFSAVTGSGKADHITGGIKDFDGFERYSGNAGNDFFDGGSGYDALDYRSEVLNGYQGSNGERVKGTQGVTVNFSTGRATDSFGDTDTFKNFEAARGTTFNDTFIGGDGGAIRFRGLGGDDTFTGGAAKERIAGGAGNDMIDGGAGTEDIVDYYDESRFNRQEGNRDGHTLFTKGVTVDLLAGTATDTFGDTDTLKNIETVWGTNLTDTITGNHGKNKIWGAGGDDILKGLGGDDRFHADKGDDTIDGGDGVDTALYKADFKNFKIQKTGDKAYTITDNDANRSGTDSLVNIERLEFNDGILALDIDGNAGQAYRIYKAAFARDPDNDGLKYWISQVDNGTGLIDVAKGFLASDEFKSVYGSDPTSEQFVSKLYSNVLGREGEAGGVAFWKGELDSGKRDMAKVLADFSESEENIAGVAPVINDGIWYT
ncbi:MAG: DUF4214 domain-containing protein [Cohaesibacter sp.]|nr:DUF4214 domain-containing protein [Cohaesibacter sp.]